MLLRAIIFDLDGVLADTAELHYQAWKQLADEEGIPFTRDDNEALRGVSREESLSLLLKGRPIQETVATEWMARKNQYYLDRIRRLGPKDLLPGAVEILQEFHDAGIKVAIASASKNAAKVVDQIGLYPHIQALVDGSEVIRAKPEPELFLLAAKKLGEPAESCLVIEDSSAGIEAARRAGMRSIGLGPPDRVGGADIVLPSLSGLGLEDILNHLDGPVDNPGGRT